MYLICQSVTSMCEYHMHLSMCGCHMYLICQCVTSMCESHMYLICQSATSMCECNMYLICQSVTSMRESHMYLMCERGNVCVSCVCTDVQIYVYGYIYVSVTCIAYVNMWHQCERDTYILCVRGAIRVCLTYVQMYRYMCMGWLRLVGSIKLQVSFATEPYTRDDILQKRPLILWSLLTVATPYGYIYTHYMHAYIYITHTYWPSYVWEGQCVCAACMYKCTDICVWVYEHRVHFQPCNNSINT